MRILYRPSIKKVLDENITHLYTLEAVLPKDIMDNGYFYNGRTFDKLSPSGWHIATRSDWETVFSTLGLTTIGDTVYGAVAALRNVEFISDYLYYNSLLEPSGARVNSEISNQFQNKSIEVAYSFGDIPTNEIIFNFTSGNAFFTTNGNINYGNPVRFVKNDLTTDPVYGLNYIGNDRNTRTTIYRIGDQVWTNPIRETRYNDGTIIPEIYENTEWSNTVIGARTCWNNDEYSIANKGWRTIREFDWINIINYITDNSLSVDNICVGESKFWNYIGSKNNSLNFYGKGCGFRRDYGGNIATFETTRIVECNWCDYDRVLTINSSYTEGSGVYENVGMGSGFGGGFGFATRLANNNTILSSGETGTYIGNDGRSYKTVCINGIEYTEQLQETKFRNKINIPHVQSKTDWGNLSSVNSPTLPAYCILDYNVIDNNTIPSNL